MKSSKTLKIIVNIVYVIGVIIVLCLIIVNVFGSNQPINPDAMIPYAWKEQAFIGLAFGAIPMLISCLTVYLFNDIKNTNHKKWKFCLIFLPGFICSACLIFIIGVVTFGMFNMFNLK